MDRYRNGLFAIFVAQLGKVSSDVLAEAQRAWSADSTQTIAEFLQERGAIDANDAALIESLVEQAVRAHQDDPEATLHAFGGIPHVEETLIGSATLHAADTVVGSPDPFPDSRPSYEEIAVLESSGRYTSQREYARGGMGRVLLVHDEQIGREVALKELLPDALPNAESASGPERPSPVQLTVPLVARFLKEAKITGQLEHPSIVPVYELGRRADGSLYYTMKVVRGQTMSQAIRSAGDLEARLNLLPHFVDLCQAIAYAHSRGVVHRDIKPGNVMVGEFGETVVLDWGLAKSTNTEDLIAEELQDTYKALNTGDEDEFAKTAYGQALGTPAYMAPEQAKGQLDIVDERSDVYALGVVLYELLTSTTPFQGTTLQDTLERVIGETPPPVREVEPAAPPELAAICKKAMEKNRDDRYASASELAEDIQRFQSGALVQAHQYGLRELAGRFVRKYRYPIAGLATAALILFATVVVYTIQLRESNQRLEVAFRETDEARILETQARERAEETARSLEQSNYLIGLRLVEEAIEDGAIAKATELLDQSIAHLRHWEWGYLSALVDSSEQTFAHHEDAVVGIAYDATSEYIHSATVDGTLATWAASTGQLVRTTGALRSATPLCIAASSPEPLVAIGFDDGRMIVVDATTHDVIQNYAAHDAAVLGLEFAPDGRTVVSVSDDRTIKIWNTADGALIDTLRGHGDSVNSVAYSPDGSRIATTGFDRTIKVWSVADRRTVHSIPTAQSVPMWVAFAPDGRRIATAASNGFVRVLSAESGESLLEWRGHDGLALCIDYSPDGKSMVTASKDGTAKLWGTEDGSLLATLHGHDGPVMRATFRADGEHILTGGNDGAVKTWTPWNKSFTVEGHTDAVYASDFSPDGSLVLTASRDGTARVWYRTDPQSPIVTVRHDDAIFAAAFSPAGDRIVTASADRSVVVWNAATGAPRFTLTRENARFFDAAFAPDGHTLVTATDTGKVDVWDANTGTHLTSLAGHDDDVFSVAFSRDGGQIVTASTDGTARIWNAQTGALLTTLDKHSAALRDATFGPNGKTVATAANNGTVNVWQIDSGAQILALNGHTDAVESVRFSPDGARLLTASDDGTVRLWNAQTGRQTIAVTVGARVFNARFDRQGRTIVASATDGQTHVWHAKEWNASN